MHIRLFYFISSLFNYIVYFWYQFLFCNILSLLGQTNFPICRTLKGFRFWLCFFCSPACLLQASSLIVSHLIWYFSSLFCQLLALLFPAFDFLGGTSAHLLFFHPSVLVPGALLFSFFFINHKTAVNYKWKVKGLSPQTDGPSESYIRLFLQILKCVRIRMGIKNLFPNCLIHQNPVPPSFLTTQLHMTKHSQTHMSMLLETLFKNESEMPINDHLCEKTSDMLKFQ